MPHTSPNSPKIKLFLDGADRSTLIEMVDHPLVQGFTTNPSLMKKAGVKDYATYCQELLTHLKGKPISYEVFADDIAEMKRQAHTIRSWDSSGKQIYVKIPVTNSRGESTAALVRDLSHSGICLNVTAICTLSQVQTVCDALKGGAPSIVSVFAGRVADCGSDPMHLMTGSAKLCRAAGREVELLWASTREAYNVVQAEQSGCQIITAPMDVIKKVTQFGKDLASVSLESVKQFKADSDAAGFQLKTG